MNDINPKIKNSFTCDVSRKCLIFVSTYPLIFLVLC